MKFKIKLSSSFILPLIAVLIFSSFALAERVPPKCGADFFECSSFNNPEIFICCEKRDDCAFKFGIPYCVTGCASGERKCGDYCCKPNQVCGDDGQGDLVCLNQCKADEIPCPYRDSLQVTCCPAQSVCGIDDPLDVAKCLPKNSCYPDCPDRADWPEATACCGGRCTLPAKRFDCPPAGGDEACTMKLDNPPCEFACFDRNGKDCGPGCTCNEFKCVCSSSSSSNATH